MTSRATLRFLASEARVISGILDAFSTRLVHENLAPEAGQAQSAMIDLKDLANQLERKP